MSTVVWSRVVSRRMVGASIALAFFLFPVLTYAANLNSLTEVVNAGHYIHEGDTVYRSDFPYADSYWRFRFTFPYGVGNPQALLGVMRGTFGNLAGGAPVAGDNFFVNYQTWNAGASDIGKSMGFSPGGTTLPSGTYTTVVANEGGSFNTLGFINWFASGGTAGQEPSDYSFLTFNYIASERVEEIPGAVTRVQYADRSIYEDDEVYRDEVVPSVDNPSGYWRFSFDWPNAVDNAHAAFMVFRGTYGDLDGGAAVNGMNYGANLQTWPAGHNVEGKFIAIPPLEAVSTDPSIYTVMVAELNPAGTLASAAEWFASGGGAGVGPRRYSLLTFDFKGDEPQYAECCSSVMFLPGIQGSVLSDGANMLWPPTFGNVGEDLGKLALYADGTPVTPGVTVEGIVNTATIGPVSVPIYQGFTDFMDSLVDDGTINDWEPLAYDWRFSPAQLLADGSMVATIEELAAASQTGQVTLVAHSMGGLMGKALIQELVEKGEEDLVDSFVMVASPQLGTPQASSGLLHGEGSSIGWGPFIFVTKAEARGLGYNLESAHHLLPSERYFEDVVDPPVTFDSLMPLTLPWRNLWGLALTDYSELFQFLSGTVLGIPVRVRPAYEDTQMPEVLREDLLTNAALFHQEFDGYAFPPDMRVVEVAGWGLETIKGIEYTEDDGELDYQPLFTTEGDKTVVYPSAVSSSGEVHYFNLDAYGDISQDVEHGNLLGAPPVTDLIKDIVQENPITTTQYIVSSKPNPTDAEDRLLVSVHSPMTIGAYEGANFTGLTPGQDPSADVQFITADIPGSQYLPFGMGKYILLPNGGTYSFVFQGTGDGTATVNVSELINDVQSPLASYPNIPVKPSTIATLNLAPDAGEAHLTIDLNGDTQPDMYIAPEGGALSLGELLVNLKTVVQNLDTSDKLKVKLLKKVEKIEKKIAKHKFDKASKAAMNLEKKVMKMGEKDKINDADVQELLTLLNELENAL